MLLIFRFLFIPQFAQPNIYVYLGIFLGACFSWQPSFFRLQRAHLRSGKAGTGTGTATATATATALHLHLHVLVHVQYLHFRLFISPFTLDQGVDALPAHQ